MPNRRIELHDTRSYTSRFIRSEKLKELLREGFGRFFIVRVEEMYPLVRHPVPPSRSTTHSCLFLTEGTATMEIGSDRYSIGRNEMLFVPAGQVFSFSEHDINRGYLCNFHDDFPVGKFGSSGLLREFEFLRAWGNPKIRLDRSAAQSVRQILSRMLFEYSRHGAERLDLLQPYLITLLCEANRAYEPSLRVGPPQSLLIANRFTELLFLHFRSKHRVSEYASLLNITPNHLGKTVREVTGKSPARWIDEAIVMEAKVLLSRSDLPIKGIAMEIGFDDHSYFTRLFKRHEGRSPTEYRAMLGVA